MNTVYLYIIYIIYIYILYIYIIYFFFFTGAMPVKICQSHLWANPNETVFSNLRRYTYAYG